MGWSKEVKFEDNSFSKSSFKLYIKYKDMAYHWVVHWKMEPIKVDEWFQRKAFKNELGSTLNVYAPTYELYVAEDIPEGDTENPNRLGEEAIGNLEAVTK